MHTIIIILIITSAILMQVCSGLKFTSSFGSRFYVSSKRWYYNIEENINIRLYSTAEFIYSRICCSNCAICCICANSFRYSMQRCDPCLHQRREGAQKNRNDIQIHSTALPRFPYLHSRISHGVSGESYRLNRVSSGIRTH